MIVPRFFRIAAAVAVLSTAAAPAFATNTDVTASRRIFMDDCAKRIAKGETTKSLLPMPWCMDIASGKSNPPTALGLKR